jgi:hypothetical protein
VTKDNRRETDILAALAIRWSVQCTAASFEGRATTSVRGATFHHAFGGIGIIRLQEAAIRSYRYVTQDEA